jgi:MFS family permease
MAYMSSLNMVVAFFSAISPMIGGLFADFFSTHQLVSNFQWKGSDGIHTLEMIDLQGWSFLFIIGGVLALASLRLLTRVKEQGEIQKERVMMYMKVRLRKRIKTNSDTILRTGIIRPVNKVQTMLRYKQPEAL